MKPEVRASLDLLTCQIAVWFDLSITRFSAFSDSTVILEEVRDCSSGVDGVLFFVPGNDYRLCEILRSLVRNLRSTTRNCINFGQKFSMSAKIRFFILQSLCVH